MIDSGYIETPALPALQGSSISVDTRELYAKWQQTIYLTLECRQTKSWCYKENHK